MQHTSWCLSDEFGDGTHLQLPDRRGGGSGTAPASTVASGCSKSSGMNQTCHCRSLWVVAVIATVWQTNAGMMVTWPALQVLINAMW